eukprot:6186286-Pleurochrysis_carterae.AAC.3
MVLRPSYETLRLPPERGTKEIIRFQYACTHACHAGSLTAAPQRVRLLLTSSAIVRGATTVRLREL